MVIKMEHNSHELSDELRSPNEIVSSSNEGDECTSIAINTTTKKVTANRNSRTSRACEGCRKKKIACNGRQPCKACSIRKRDCVYTTLTVTGRPSKGAVKLLQRQIEILEAEIEELRNGGNACSGQTGGGSGAHTKFKSKFAESEDGTRKFGEIPLSRTYGPLGRGDNPTSSAATTSNTIHRDSLGGGEDDFFFLAQNLNRNLSIIPTINSTAPPNPNFVHQAGSNTKHANMFDLHTSFRLERQENGDFSSSLGWCMTALRLGESVLNGVNFFEKRGGDVDTIQQQSFSTTQKYPSQQQKQQPQQRSENPLIEPFVSSNVLLHWPSREREEQLFNVYFRLVQPSWPILCKDTLKQQRSGQLRNIFQNDPVWISIMLGMFISAGRYVPSEKENLQFWWKSRMQLGGHDLIHCSSIGGVQNLLMTIQIRSCLIQRTHIDWVATGMAIRAMQDRGLHREAVLKTLHRDPGYVSLIRCLWWAAQKADIDLCSRWGRTPAAISFDVLPPRGSSMSSPIPYFIASLRGLRITSQILDVRYLRDRELRESVTKEVQRWMQELKEYFPFIPKERDDEKIFASAKLTLFANSVIALAYKSSVYIVFRSLSTENNKKKREMNEQDLQDYEKAKVIMKEVIQSTAKIAKALADRSRHDVQFFDDDISAQIGSVQLIACLLCFAEKLRGGKDDALLASVTTICDAIQRCNYNGTITTTAKEFCRTMMIQLTKKLNDDHEMSGMGEENPNLSQTPFSSFPNHQPYSSFSEASFSVQANMCTIPDVQMFDPMSNNKESGGMPYTTGQARSSFMNDDQSNNLQQTFRAAISMMDKYTQPRILMDNVQYAKASPDSKLWDDVLHNEIMLLDGMTNTTAGFPYSTPQFCIPNQFQSTNQPGSSSTNTTLGSSTSSEFPLDHDKQLINTPNMLELTNLHQHQPPSLPLPNQDLQLQPILNPNPNFGNLGMRRGSAQIPILSSMWLGPDVENAIPPSENLPSAHSQEHPVGEGNDGSPIGHNSNLPRFHVSNIFSSTTTTNSKPQALSSPSSCSSTNSNPNFPQTAPTSNAVVVEDFQGFSNALNTYKIPSSFNITATNTASVNSQQHQRHQSSSTLQNHHQSSIDPHCKDPSWNSS